MDKYAIVSGPEGDELIEAYQKPNKDMYFEFLSEACEAPLVTKIKEISIDSLKKVGSNLVELGGSCQTVFSDISYKFKISYDTMRHVGFLTLSY